MIAPTSTPAPKPTPGATAWLVAVETADTPHGPHTTTSTHRWDGHTAADLRATGKTITRTFHDEEPAS